MEHVVFYPALDGAPAFRRFASLDDAVRFVEHLRNAEGVSEVSVHTLSPVPLAFRAYYKVEVPQDGPAEMPEPVVSEPVVSEPVSEPAMSEPVYDVPAPAEAPAAEFVAPEPEPAMAEAVVVAPPASSNGKKSLGFFAH